MVSFASGDLSAADRDHATAQALVGSCAECARLHDDVLAVASATKALPPPVRTRDFRITNEQAAKLRPAGLRGVLSRLTAPGRCSAASSASASRRSASPGCCSAPRRCILGWGRGIRAGGEPAGERDRAGGTGLGGVRARGVRARGVDLAGPGVFELGGAAEAEASIQPHHDTSAPQPSSERSSSGRNIVGGAAASAAPASAVPAAAGTAAPDDENATLSTTADSGSSGGPSPLIVVSALLLAAGILVLLVRRLSRAAVSG